ncbi:hypothetical protein DM01DRAFT_324276 [Hesseltinella vesiculosa]|uniref:C2H2-type domain-containing protein n=1 Tax=Hesseltinella vesiculosa TaxID=101127 RepID=A0A1X2G4Q7_9FUNG|nr:hypothetical protein DM01DRAFT_324276 [Hesseltinella vesiculosa]
MAAFTPVTPAYPGSVPPPPTVLASPPYYSQPVMQQPYGYYPSAVPMHPTAGVPPPPMYYRDEAEPLTQINTKPASSLPSELQRLSLCAPAHESQATPAIDQDQPLVNNPALLSVTPSWMSTSKGSPVQTIPTTPTMKTYPPLTYQHQRSISEMPIQPAFSESHPARNLAAPIYPAPMTSLSLTTSSPLASPNSSLPAKRAFHHQHRRAVSANTVDFMLHDTIDENLVRRSAPTNDTNSPASSSPSSSSTTSNLSASGRYVCPYCQKRFSRPSSLRIHIYSHTGEKPFVCPEEGCGRRFSVQSNMRRHLRVHRLSRSNQPSPLKIEATP